MNTTTKQLNPQLQEDILLLFKNAQQEVSFIQYKINLVKEDVDWLVNLLESLIIWQPEHIHREKEGEEGEEEGEKEGKEGKEGN